ncbi:MAG: thioredoxin [Thermoproteota archaeon]|nr:thioredoxin [Thermoproteota archaeon]
MKHKGLISEDDKQLKEIRRKKRRELMERMMEKEMGEPIVVGDSNFDELVKKNSLTVIDCWAPWCAPCLVVSPIIEELAKEYAGKVAFGKLNTDENPYTAGRFGILGIPTLLFMKDGKEVDRIVGVVPKEFIESKLQKHLNAT